VESFFYVLDESLSILMADDDPIMREFASVYLSSPSAEIHTVPDGLAALSRLSEAMFDVLLLDLDMPVLSGFDTLERIRADSATRDLPVIVISGREDIESIDRAYKLGATSFVTKPVNWRLLAYQIKYVLRAAKHERAG
jgi:CheY-like chemotaxis protein